MFEPADTSLLQNEANFSSSIKDTLEAIFNFEDSFCKQHISVFEILRTYQEIKTNKQETKKEIEGKIESKIKSIDSNYYVTLHDFDYEDDVITVSVHSLVTDKETKVCFKKNECEFEILKISGKKRAILSNILTLIGSELEMWFDYSQSLRDVETKVYSDICSVNSSFKLVISSICINMYYNKSYLTSDFRLLLFCESNKIYCRCKDNDIITLLTGREIEFAKRVMVLIADCPKWMQEQLAITRKEQIEEKEQKEQEEQIRQEKFVKKQKRKAILRKFFPFLKNEKI